MKKGRVMCSKADKAGHESHGEDCGLPHQTCQSVIPSLALSQAEAQQMQSLQSRECI